MENRITCVAIVDGKYPQTEYIFYIQHFLHTLLF